MKNDKSCLLSGVRNVLLASLKDMEHFQASYIQWAQQLSAEPSVIVSALISAGVVNSSEVRASAM